VNRSVDHLEVATANNYYTLADFHNLQSLHTNLLSLLSLVFVSALNHGYFSATSSPFVS
jgi:hypothetical protein